MESTVLGMACVFVFRGAAELERVHGVWEPGAALESHADQEVEALVAGYCTISRPPSSTRPFPQATARDGALRPTTMASFIPRTDDTHNRHNAKRTNASARTRARGEPLCMSGK